MQMHDPKPDRILEIGYAFWKSKVLLSAVEFDLAVRDQEEDAIVAKMPQQVMQQ